MPEQRRGALVVVRQAAVREQVRGAGVEEQLRVIDGPDELASGGEILVDPLVVLSSSGSRWMDVIGPRVAELGGRQRGTEEQRAPRAGRVSASSWAGTTPSEKPA